MTLKDDNRVFPISFSCNGSWLYTFMFVISWIAAPMLIIVSKLKRLIHIKKTARLQLLR